MIHIIDDHICAKHGTGITRVCMLCVTSELSAQLDDAREQAEEWKQRAEQAEAELLLFREHADSSCCYWCGWVTKKSDAEGMADHMISCGKRPEAQRDTGELTAARALIGHQRRVHSCATGSVQCGFCELFAAYDTLATKDKPE